MDNSSKKTSAINAVNQLISTKGDPVIKKTAPKRKIKICIPQVEPEIVKDLIVEEIREPEIVLPPENTVKKVSLYPQKSTISASEFFGSPVAIEESPIIHKNFTMNLSEQQQFAFDKFKSGENLFITGPGGTGKTHLIREFMGYANLIGKKIQVTALTGCAALLLRAHAKTIHSWSGIRLAKGDKSSVILRALRNKKAMQEWKHVEVLIIDEVSMMSQKIFDIIEELARVSRKSSRPFGGIQVICCGDFFQLPPVGDINEPDTCNFCFESPNWYKIFNRSNHIELKTIFRQNDSLFIDILQKVRLGELSPEHQAVLEKHVNRDKPTDLIVPIKLFAVKSKTEFVNKAMYSKLDGPEKEYACIRKLDCKTYLDSGDPIPQPILNFCSRISEQDVIYELEQLINNLPFPHELELKVGALVMCRYNVDLSAGICNGTQGVVIDFHITTGAPIVRWLNGIVMTMELQYFQSDECPSIAIAQYPLCLAWAITIHKIQGATLDMAEMDLGTSIFEYSQSYVALSRVKNLDGLYLTSFNPTKIRVNPKVKDFYAKNNLLV